MAEQFEGHEHLRWSASWSTREDQDEYKFRRGLAEKLGAKGWLFPIYPKKYGGAELDRRSSDGARDRAVQVRAQSFARILHPGAYRRAGADSLGNRRTEKRISCRRSRERRSASGRCSPSRTAAATSPIARPRRSATAMIMSSMARKSWSAIICRRIISGRWSAPHPQRQAP